MILKLTGVSKKYPDGAGIDGISFGVERGRIAGFVGANGAGKTTTIKAILGFHRIDRGDIRLFDCPHTDPEARRRIGFLPENPWFQDGLTGFEFLEFFGRLSGLSKVKARTRAAAVLELVELSGHGHRRLRDYSKGMVQRIGLAQALVHDPDLLILDEPVSGLDPVGRVQVRRIMQVLREQGKTVFFSSHIIPDVEAICDEVVIIHKGRIVPATRRDLLDQGVKYWEWDVEKLNVAGLKKLFPTCRYAGTEGSRTVLHLENAGDSVSVHRKIADAGGVVASFGPVRESLEDALFELAREKRP